MGEKEKEIVEKLAGALDSRGYLEIPVKKLAEYIPCSVRELRSALEILKSLEPAGIGAADLKECLILQLRRQKDSRLAVTLVKNYLEDLPKHRISAIAKELGENEDAVKDAFARINLNPKTGKYFRGRNNGALCNTRYYCVKRTWKIHSGIERGCVPETAAE